jgi:hypothetical protein
MCGTEHVKHSRAYITEQYRARSDLPGTHKEWLALQTK